MANARGAVFIFVIVAVGILGLTMTMAFISENNRPELGSVATNASIYVTNSTPVNQSMQFIQNVSVSGTTFVSPLPLLAAIFALAAGLLVLLLVVKRR